MLSPGANTASPSSYGTAWGKSRESTSVGPGCASAQEIMMVDRAAKNLRSGERCGVVSQLARRAPANLAGERSAASHLSSGAIRGTRSNASLPGLVVALPYCVFIVVSTFFVLAEQVPGRQSKAFLWQRRSRMSACQQPDRL